MEPVGVRELRRQASAILRRVAAGVTVMVRTMPSGLARLEREGLLRRAEGELLDLATVHLPPGVAEPSRIVAEGRAE